MADGSYNQFCPVAMAAEILCTRWTIVLLRELVAGSTRFNELRRGVPRMSPALLSKRLKDLEAAGVVARSQLAGDPGLYEYTLTTAGKFLHADPGDPRIASPSTSTITSVTLRIISCFWLLSKTPSMS